MSKMKDFPKREIVGEMQLGDIIFTEEAICPFCRRKKAIFSMEVTDLYENPRDIEAEPHGKLLSWTIWCKKCTNGQQMAYGDGMVIIENKGR